MKLSALAVVLVALGIVLGLAIRGVVLEAEAARPPRPTPTPTPAAPQPVEEQNLDANGYIAVHEQGTADVNVTNASLPVSGTVDVGNLPTVQDVNVVGMPTQEGRLIELTVAPDATGAPYSPFVDISDCGLISILARGGTIHDITNASPDGTTRVEVKLSGVLQSGNVDGSPTSSMQNVQVALPFLQVRLMSASGGTAWIWCVP